MRLRFVEEPDPRGTAGALKFAEELLDERFLMLNGDVLTDLDLSAQIAQHEATGATGTLALVPVPDPSSYGLVRLREDNSVDEFLEKPSADTVLDTNLISAGAYVLERSVLDMIAPDRNVSIEREVWPALVDHGLYGYVDDDAYWIDVGTPERYLQATFDILEGNVRTQVQAKLGDGYLAVDPSARVDGPRGPARRRRRRRDDRRGRPRRQPRGDRRRRARSAPARSSSAPSCSTARGSASTASCATASSPPAPPSAIAARSSAARCSAKASTIGADNVIARGARLFPGMEVPDGGLAF